jgi:hypothetical protein
MRFPSCKVLALVSGEAADIAGALLGKVPSVRFADGLDVVCGKVGHGVSSLLVEMDYTP